MAQNLRNKILIFCLVAEIFKFNVLSQLWRESVAREDLAFFPAQKIPVVAFLTTHDPSSEQNVGYISKFSLVDFEPFIKGLFLSNFIL